MTRTPITRRLMGVAAVAALTLGLAACGKGEEKTSGAAPTEITLELVMTDDQMAIFESWYEHRVDSGAAWFDAPMANGQGLTTVEARFVEPWQSQPLGAGLNRVACKWETRNRPIMSDADLTAAGVT